MSLQFVVKDENGRELDWVDPVRAIFVQNDVGEYEMPVEPGYTYELKELTDVD